MTRASFTDEDRTRVETWRDELWNSAGSNHIHAGRDEHYAELLHRALAYIDRLERLRAADAMPTSTLYERERRADALALARAALKGDTDA